MRKSEKRHGPFTAAAITVATAAVLAFAGAAHAAPTIVTGGLEPLPGGRIECRIVNASANRTLDVTMEILTFAGTVLETDDFEVGPRTSRCSGSSDAQARFCVVTVKSGGKRNGRVTLYTFDSSNEIRAAVHGK